MNLSVVIPAYNESDNIGSTVNEILSIADKIPEIGKMEIIIVDDHSSDGTYDSIVKMSEDRVKCVRLSRSSGSHVAIRAGLREATGDAALVISADGQDDPACLKTMLEKWRKGAHTVWALRKSRDDEPWYIKKPAKSFYRLLSLLGGTGATDIDVSRINFYLLDRKVIDAVNNCSDRNTSVFGLIAWLGFNQDWVEYERRLRRFGKSKWNFVKRLRLASDWIVGFSGLPLTITLVIGAVATVVGVLYAVYVIIAMLMGRAMSGWIYVMAAILLLGGVQMMMIGIIGEYLWRNLDESRKRPLFFIEKRSA